MRSWTPLIAALTLMTPGVALAGEDKDKGGGPPHTPPGQEKKAEHASPQPAPAPAESADASGKDRGEKPEKGDKKDKAEKKDRSDKAGRRARTTICHATRSGEYKEMRVSDDDLKKHERRHDDRDIIPAPEGGCPEPAPAPALAAPAPAPKPRAAAPKPTARPARSRAARKQRTASRKRATPARSPVGRPTTTRARRTRPVRTTPTVIAGSFSPPRTDDTEVEAREATPRAAAATNVSAPARNAGSLGLPFSGLDAWLMIAAAFGLAIAAVAGRRAATRRG